MGRDARRARPRQQGVCSAAPGQPASPLAGASYNPGRVTSVQRPDGLASTPRHAKRGRGSVDGRRHGASDASKVAHQRGVTAADLRSLSVAWACLSFHLSVRRRQPINRIAGSARPGSLIRPDLSEIKPCGLNRSVFHRTTRPSRRASLPSTRLRHATWTMDILVTIDVAAL